jgi:hypothetical protein
MRKLGTIFKQHNPSWVNVKSIMTDKDFEKRKIFHEDFPNAKFLISKLTLPECYKVWVESNFGIIF